MKAMILAAGLGERMRPLTDQTPKPLLRAAGVPLIEYHLRQLATAGLREVVINVSHLAAQIVAFCGDGARWGLTIQYSHEAQPLETAGGIVHALPLLGDAPFALINGDIWTDFPLARLAQWRLAPDESARLVLVDNPPQHSRGDFVLGADGRVLARAENVPSLTYAGLGVYRPAMFAGLADGKLPLLPLLNASIADGSLGGEHYTGRWQDIGTPERLHALDAALREQHAR